MAAGNDIKAAQETYGAFVGAVKVATPLLGLLTAFVIYLIAR